MSLLADRKDVPSRKKHNYPVNDTLRKYLIKYDREVKLPVMYTDMLRFNLSVPLLDNNGVDTLWHTVYYDESEMKDLFPGLEYIYALLHASGRMEVMEHLSVARIDYCSFGNSKPFRVRIINRFNDNYDHFYVKVADASRVYGLELEHILSPNRINYLTDSNTLIEEHIAGMPGDVFIKQAVRDSVFNKTRICKEFVKFNERCFVRLLGDMRSYNYVVDITPDIEGNQYRLRAIDFDQQSYEGRLKFYLPHFFKENNKLVFMGIGLISEASMLQYQQEERHIIRHRARAGQKRLKEVFHIMSIEKLAPEDKIVSLGKELAAYHQNQLFTKIRSMGGLVKEHLFACIFHSK